MNNNFFVRNKSIMTFLILEVLALTAFNFGNISYIFGIAGGVLALCGIPFVLQNVKEKKSLLWLLLPIGLLLVISSFGAFNAFSKGFTVTSNISLFVALPAFFALGFFLRKLDDVKPKTVIMILGVGLAAITLFGLASTLIEYGLFYSLIYKSTPNYYYNGIPYDVTKEMYWLTGFGFNEVFVEYGSLFAVLCASFLPGLLFLSPKKDRNEFIVSTLVGGIGLVTLLVIPNWKALLVLVVASAFAFIYKYLRNHKKVLKILGISFVSVLGLGVLFFLVALLNAAIGFKFTGFLEKLFVTNGIMNKCTPIFEALFAKGGGNLFGLQPTSFNQNITMQETGIFEVQLLKEVGLFGTLIFVGFIIMMGYFLYKYIKHSDDHDHVKVIAVTMLLAFFIFETLFNVILIQPHGEAYNAFLRSPELLVILFVFGFTFMIPHKEEKHE